MRERSCLSCYTPTCGIRARQLAVAVDDLEARHEGQSIQHRHCRKHTQITWRVRPVSGLHVVGGLKASHAVADRTVAAVLAQVCSFSSMHMGSP